MKKCKEETYFISKVINKTSISEWYVGFWGHHDILWGLKNLCAIFSWLKKKTCSQFKNIGCRVIRGEPTAINQGFWGLSVHISTSDAAYQKCNKKIVAQDNNSRLMCYQSQWCKTLLFWKHFTDIGKYGRNEFIKFWPILSNLANLGSLSFQRTNLKNIDHRRHLKKINSSMGK